MTKSQRLAAKLCILRDMALKHGRAGKTLRNKLSKVAVVLGMMGFSTWLIIKISVPWLAPVAPLLAVLVIFRLLEDKDVSRNISALSKGYAGEAYVGKVLETLPSGWRVFHDLDLGGENVDHLVIGPGGVFSLEVKNYSGKVTATPTGLYNKGERQDKIVKQAWRQSHKLRELLGVEVVPILVFVGDELEGSRVGRLMVKRPRELVPFFRNLPKVWEYKEFLEVVRRAERLVK